MNGILDDDSSCLEVKADSKSNNDSAINKKDKLKIVHHQNSSETKNKDKTVMKKFKFFKSVSTFVEIDLTHSSNKDQPLSKVTPITSAKPKEPSQITKDEQQEVGCGSN